MLTAWHLVAGDTGTAIRGTIKDRQTAAPVDLTGAAVKLIWRIDGGTKVERAMTIVDLTQATNKGVARYQFAAGELTAVPYGSTLTAEIEVTDAGGKALTGLDPIELKVRAKI